jgi:hypothetical protein
MGSTRDPHPQSTRHSLKSREVIVPAPQLCFFTPGCPVPFLDRGPSFILRGAYFVVTYLEKQVLIPTSIGAYYLHFLIRHRTRSVLALTLVDIVNSGGTSVPAPTKIDDHVAAGGVNLHEAEVFDNETVNQVKREIEQRRQSLARDALSGQPRDAAAIRDDKLWLKKAIEYIERGSNVHGKPRRFRGPIEAARQSVHKAIKGVILKIRQGHPGLADHFEASIRLGTEVEYRPEPDVEWHTT